MRKKAGLLLLLLLAVCTLNGCGERAAGIGKENTAPPQAAAEGEQKAAEPPEALAETGDAPAEDLGELKVHFIDVGQGDATLIQQGSHAMLIDAGNNDKGTAVQAYLNSQQVTSLDYVIGTHPDADHIGGLDVILYKFGWDKVILPEVEKDTKTCQEVLQVIRDKNQPITYPVPGQAYQLGQASFTIIAPVGKDYGDSINDYSVGILLTFGEKRFLFTGDAEEAAEQDMLQEGIPLSADVFKAAHHGSNTANTKAFLDAVNPSAVVISCGEDNTYGHPRAAVLNELRARGTEVYRTDEQGTILAVCDGRDIVWNCAPSNSWKAGEPEGGGDSGSSAAGEPAESGNSGSSAAGEPAGGGESLSPEPEVPEGESGEAEPQQEVTYILNTNTQKFHRPDCSSVDQMKDKNRKSSSLSREALISSGYAPCKRCNP